MAASELTLAIEKAALATGVLTRIASCPTRLLYA